MSYYEAEQLRQQRQQAWLDGLQPGDGVAILYGGGFYGPRYEFSTLDKRTNTQLIVGGNKYRLNGQRCGDNQGQLVEPTIELKQKIANDNEHLKLQRQLDGIKWRRQSLETLRAVVAAIPPSEVPR